jgi:hypothetical protein
MKKRQRNLTSRLPLGWDQTWLTPCDIRDMAGEAQRSNSAAVAAIAATQAAHKITLSPSLVALGIARNGKSTYRLAV